MENNQKSEKPQDESYRDEVEKFSRYIETNNKDIIKDISLSDLKKVVEHYRLTHNHMDWFDAIEKRIKELEAQK